MTVIFRLKRLIDLVEGFSNGSWWNTLGNACDIVGIGIAVFFQIALYSREYDFDIWVVKEMYAGQNLGIIVCGDDDIGLPLFNESTHFPLSPLHVIVVRFFLRIEEMFADNVGIFLFEDALKADNLFCCPGVIGFVAMQ